MSHPDVGDTAPAFTLPRDGGGDVSLSDFVGKQVVLYFYPKDDTPGCTKEAIGFTDMVAEFDARREVIVRELNALPGFRCTDAAGAFYAFPNIEGTGMTSKEAQDCFLDEAGVATVAGTSFGSYGEGYVRFSYANSTDNILEAVRRIRDLL